jgi:hypothetical protein
MNANQVKRDEVMERLVKEAENKERAPMPEMVTAEDLARQLEEAAEFTRKIGGGSGKK